MDIKNKKIKSYWGIGIGFSAASILLSQFHWHGSAELHTLMESLATVLALFVGLLALIRFYSRGGNNYLVLGAGFIAIAMLDGYHAVVSSIWFKAYLPSDLPSLIPWSWLASRLFKSHLNASLLLSLSPHYAVLYFLHLRLFPMDTLTMYFSIDQRNSYPQHFFY